MNPVRLRPDSNLGFREPPVLYVRNLGRIPDPESLKLGWIRLFV